MSNRFELGSVLKQKWTDLETWVDMVLINNGFGIDWGLVGGVSNEQRLWCMYLQLETNLDSCLLPFQFFFFFFWSSLICTMCRISILSFYSCLLNESSLLMLEVAENFIYTVDFFLLPKSALIASVTEVCVRFIKCDGMCKSETPPPPTPKKRVCAVSVYVRVHACMLECLWNAIKWMTECFRSLFTFHVALCVFVCVCLCVCLCVHAHT